ncbi:hypothetical protein Ocin01_08563 [Orchesella cincta]|uniref:Uncharacterized protein n=1 Tax=Orchesella cincta TaxID=48709 RepID=A0A1D2MZ97_ORCCI|nr:hypothetical protein Ocin01_08563 [Orchesella cincta]
MVPHGYLSDTEREGTGGDLESMKCKEKEFYKSLKEKTLIGLPFIQTEDLSCFIMRLCPVFKSAITIKPVRRRPKKPSQSKKVENKPMEEVNKQMEAESKPMEVESKPMEDESKPMKAESKQTDMASKVERRSVRTPKVPKPNPYDKAPSGFLGMQLPSDDEEDMDWDTEEDLDASSSSDSNSNESGDEEDDGSSSGDEDLFTPIKVVRRKV